MPDYKVEVKDTVVVTRVLYVRADSAEQAESFAENADRTGRDIGTEYLSGEVQGSTEVKEVPRKWPYFKVPPK